MIVFVFLLCCLCNASLQHLRASILEQQDDVAQLKAKVLDQPENPELLEKGDPTVSIVIDGPVVEHRPNNIWCCDPFAMPGVYPHVMCPIHGAPACCPNRQWACPASFFETGKYICNGVETTGPFGVQCPIRCCDPTKKPNIFGATKFCAYGGHCCYTGEWVCGAADGSYYCDGSKTTGLTARACPTCASSGFQCPLYMKLKANAASIVCTASQCNENLCCDRVYYSPDYAVLMDTGATGADAGGVDAFAPVMSDSSLSAVAPVVSDAVAIPPLPPAARCCDASKEPGKYGNPDCTGNAGCCLTGEWVCADANGRYTCSGQLMTTPNGVRCPLDCTRIQCPSLPCPWWQQYLPTGECCNNCKLCSNGLVPLSSDCATPQGQCPSGYRCEPWHYAIPDDNYHPAGLCCKDCAGIVCRLPPCPAWQRYTPQGECCPKCRRCRRGDAPLASPDCSTNGGVCAAGFSCEGYVRFAADGWDSYGLCCPPDCSNVVCPVPNCPLALQFKPAGSCCTLCKRATCLDGSTPFPGNCPTVACPSGSSCNGFLVSSQGSWFSYGLCCRTLRSRGETCTLDSDCYSGLRCLPKASGGKVCWPPTGPCVTEGVLIPGDSVDYSTGCNEWCRCDGTTLACHAIGCPLIGCQPGFHRVVTSSPTDCCGIQSCQPN